MRKTEKGSAHIIIISVFSVALIGALGFVFWQNFIQPKPSNESTVSTKTTNKKPDDKSGPEATTTPITQDSTLNTFTGGHGVNWLSFNYPKDWTIDTDVEISGTGPGVGPGIIIKSPEFKIVDHGQDMGPSGNFILISSTKHWNASISYRESQQEEANPRGTFGHFTFAGKPAAISRGTTAQDTTSPPVATIADMYKGESTWIQGDSIIYTFSAWTGDYPAGDEQKLYDAIKVVLSSWKWQK